MVRLSSETEVVHQDIQRALQSKERYNFKSSPSSLGASKESHRPPLQQQVASTFGRVYTQNRKYFSKYISKAFPSAVGLACSVQ